MLKEFTLQSGSRLKVQVAPFEPSVELMEAVQRAAVNADPTMDIGRIAFMSPDVRKALFKVFDTCLYNDIRITQALFDDLNYGPKIRADYYEICAHVIEANTESFFPKASSKSTTNLPVAESGQK